MQQKLFHREGHFQFKGRKSVYSVFGGGGGGREEGGGAGGNNYTTPQPVTLVLSGCLVSFQRKASSHYRNCHIIWLFMLPLRYRISF